MYVPNAYKQALKEMTRRKKFREILERDFKTLQKFINEENAKRQEFKLNLHIYLPSSFCPNLKDNVPELKLEGPSQE